MNGSSLRSKVIIYVYHCCHVPVYTCPIALPPRIHHPGLCISIILLCACIYTILVCVPLHHDCMLDIMLSVLYSYLYSVDMHCYLFVVTVYSWTSWSTWSPWLPTCGKVEVHRSRSCVVPSPDSLYCSTCGYENTTVKESKPSNLPACCKSEYTCS